MLYLLNNDLLQAFLKLFDAQVQPVTEYGSEMWGLGKAVIHTEQVRSFVLKRLLGVGMKTLNDLVHGETDRFPITLNSAVRCIRYWLKITWMVKTTGAWGNRDWFSNAGLQLLHYGFVSVMMNQGLARMSLYVVFVKDGLTADGKIGQFVLNWGQCT